MRGATFAKSYEPIHTPFRGGGKRSADHYYDGRLRTIRCLHFIKQTELSTAKSRQSTSYLRSGPTLMLVPLAHMTIIFLVGAASFYLMHIFAR